MYMNKLSNAASTLGKKRWEGVSKEERSKEMKKVRGAIDFSSIRLKAKPQGIKREVLEQIANGTQTEKMVFLRYLTTG